ncbi:MAG: hypothetical protein CM15mV92_410 [Caudoviricetes sp.]|nr:MAG: hypothetical protein CM15mV92_410 [Caudoviricetes sp.]
MELQLAIAKQKVIDLQAKSTGATQEQISAERELERAIEEEERAFDKLTKAEEKLIEAQKELNEVTAKTPENLLEIAMAKNDLDTALKDLGALGEFDDALSVLVESTGMKLQDLIDMATNIKAGKDIAFDSAGGGSTKTDTSGETVTGEIVRPVGALSGSGVTGEGMGNLQRMGAVVINQNITVEGKNANQQALDIIEAVNRAQRNGQRIVS